MEVKFWRAGPGNGIDLSGIEGVHCVRGSGRGSHALVAAGVPSLWCVLRGSVEVGTPDGPFRVQRRQFLALPAGTAVRGVGRDGADWVALALPPPAVSASRPPASGRTSPKPPDGSP